MPRAARKPKNTGLAEESRPFLHDEIIAGIDARRVQNLIDREVLSEKQVYRIIPERTFKRRVADREPLKLSEADAISRLLRIADAANRTFGDAEFARKFLALPNPALDNRIPNELAETDAGARDVERILSHIAYGDFT